MSAIGCETGVTDLSNPGEVAITEVQLCATDFFGCSKRTIWHVGETASLGGMGVAGTNASTTHYYGASFPDLFSTTWSTSDSTVARLVPSSLTCLCIDAVIVGTGKATVTLTLAGKKGSPKSAAVDLTVVAR